METDTPTPSAANSFGLDLALPYDTTREKVTRALKDEGFGVLTEIDVRATLREKLDAEFRPYTILGACNPPLAQQALSADLQVGLMLPCNVIVYETGASASRVEFMNPLTALRVLGNDAVTPVAEEAEKRLRRVLSALRGTGGDRE